MKLKSKKSALLLSFTSLLLCFAMLAGSTFAWFTDTASTGVNKIQAGNLDIEVQYRTTADGEWKPLDNAIDLFGRENTRFEPGHTRVVELKIENAGNLALKYKIGMNIASETPGTNKFGKSYKLSDSLKVATSPIQQYDPNAGPNDVSYVMEQQIFASESSFAWEHRDFANFELDKNERNHVLDLQPGDAQILGIKVYMPETVGNEANAQIAEEAASITFGLNILATQYTTERDSFSNTYDKDATYLAPGELVETEAELIAAIKNGGEVSITKDIALSSTITVTEDTVIHGNGKTIKMSQADMDIFKVSGSQETKLVLDNMVMDGGGQDLGKAFPINNGGNGTVEIRNCTIKNFSGTRAVHSEQADTVKIVDTTFENISLTGVSSDSNKGRACLLWLQGTEVLLENVTIRNCKALTGDNNSYGSGVLIYARNGGTNVTARNLVVENNIVSNHVFATYSTTNANNYIFESGPMKGNTVGDETGRSANEIFMVGNVTVGEGMTIEQNIIINNDSNNGVCTLINNGKIIGNINASFTNRGPLIYTGNGTHTGTKTNLTVQ